MHKHRHDTPAGQSGELDAFDDVVSALRRAPAPEWQGDLTDRVMARIRPTTADSRPALFVSRFAATHPAVLKWAASIAILLGATVALLVQLTEPGTEAGRLQTAVRESTAWLVGAQEPDGSWNPERWGGRGECTVGLTAMSLLALLQSPEPETAAAATRAAGYLISHQQADGQFGTPSTAAMYNHALACVALFEAARSGRAATTQSSLRAATAFICRRQLASGGWGYRSDAAAQANTGVSVWQLRALALASQSGLLADPTPYRRGLLWLKSMMNAQGEFGYQRQGESPCGTATLTAMGAYCLFAMAPRAGHGDTGRPDLASALTAAAGGNPAANDYYHWYFVAAACDASRDSRCAPVRASLRQRLLDNRTESGQYRGTWEPAGPWSQAGGRLLTTTLAALSL